MYYQRNLALFCLRLYWQCIFTFKIVKGIFKAVRDDFILDAGGSSAGPAN